MIKLRMKDKDRRIDNDIEKFEKTESACHRRGLTLFMVPSVCIGPVISYNHQEKCCDTEGVLLSRCMRSMYVCKHINVMYNVLCGVQPAVT